MDVQQATSAVTLDYVPPQMFGRVLPLVKGLLESVIARSGGRWTMKSMLRDLVAEKYKLLVVATPDAIKGIVGTHLHEASSGIRILQIVFCTGEDSKEWLHLLKLIEAHAKANGCAKVEMWARKGWARKLPDYKLTHVLLEKDLI